MHRMKKQKQTPPFPSGTRSASFRQTKEPFLTRLQYELLLLPALLFYLVFCGLPFLCTFLYSVSDYNIHHVRDLHFVGLRNYFDLFGKSLMKVSLFNSLKYAFFMTFFQSLIALPLAVMLHKKVPLRGLMRAALFLPAVFSPLVVGYLFNFILGREGFVNMLLQRLGSEGIAFFDANHALNSIILTQVWQWAGWAMVIYLANLQTIPLDMIEAARVDGAGEWAMFRRITLPLLHPAVTVVTISSLVGGLKVFDIIYATTKGGPGYATETIMSTMINVSAKKGNYALASAFGVVFFSLVLLLSLGLLRLLKAWENKVS